MMKLALERAKALIDPQGVHRLFIKSVSAKQTPRGLPKATKQR